MAIASALARLGKATHAMGNAFGLAPQQWAQQQAALSQAYTVQQTAWMNGNSSAQPSYTFQPLTAQWGNGLAYPPPIVTREPDVHPDLAWLDRRVNELRVAL